MKILYKDFRWHDATYDVVNGQFAMSDLPTQHVRETDVIAVKDDDRATYVCCPACGESILNDPELIEAHRKRSTTSDGCHACNKVRPYDIVTKDKKSVPNGDGTYTVTLTETMRMQCGFNYYNRPNIESQEARERCRYRGCLNAHMEVMQDTFTKYPGLFDTIPTVDALDKSRWSIDNVRNGYTYFLCKGTPRIYAAVRSDGIIECFYYSYKRRNYLFRYSAKYNKVFWMHYDTYKDGLAFNEMSERAMDTIMKRMAEIFKGEQK